MFIKVRIVDDDELHDSIFDKDDVSIVQKFGNKTKIIFKNGTQLICYEDYNYIVSKFVYI